MLSANAQATRTAKREPRRPWETKDEKGREIRGKPEETEIEGTEIGRTEII